MVEILLTEKTLPVTSAGGTDACQKLTDSTNAELIAGMYGDRLRYDHQRGRWLLWSGHFWREDADGEIYRLATEAARERYRQSVNIADLQERQRVAKWAIGSEQRGRLEAAVALAQNVKPIADSGKDWDTDPWLFAVANGVIDLRTGRLRAGKPEDRITLHSQVAYDEAAKCPRWFQFMDEIFRGDWELIDYIQRGLGYSLTAITREQVYFIAHGTGSNGKTIFLGTLGKVFGNYSYVAPFSTFELTNRPSIPNDLAPIERRRFVTSSETNHGSRLNEARLKMLSGEDPCTARYLHHEFFTFVPVCKIWLCVNQKPKVHDDSYGFWRKVRLIPFTRQFIKGKDADLTLLDKLLAESSGILNWLLSGCLEWQRRGLEPTPAAVMAATEAYRAETDPLAQFLADCCVLSAGASVKSSDAYKSYCEWARGEGLNERETLTSNSFGRRMGKRFEGEHGEKGKVYRGVGLKVGPG